MATDVEVLSAWASFPVSASPRSVVLVDGYVRVEGSGFTGTEAKLAYIQGRIDSRVDLPDGVFDLLAESSNDQPAHSDERITITSIRGVTAPFGTDRGVRRFAAYALQLDGVRGRVVVLDPATPVWWPKHPTSGRTSGGMATIEADDRTLHVLAQGGLLTEFLGCTFTETETAVLAGPLTRRRDSGGRAVRAIGVSKPVSGRLTRPLGGRVLISAAGLPIPVTRK